jgi:hypothetical protein
MRTSGAVSAVPFWYFPAVTDSGDTLRRFKPCVDHLAFVLSDAEAPSGLFDGETWNKADDSWRVIDDPRRARVFPALKPPSVRVVPDRRTSAIPATCRTVPG